MSSLKTFKKIDYINPLHVYTVWDLFTFSKYAHYSTEFRQSTKVAFNGVKLDHIELKDKYLHTLTRKELDVVGLLAIREKVTLGFDLFTKDLTLDFNRFLILQIMYIIEAHKEDLPPSDEDEQILEWDFTEEDLSNISPKKPIKFNYPSNILYKGFTSWTTNNKIDGFSISSTSKRGSHNDFIYDGKLNQRFPHYKTQNGSWYFYTPFNKEPKTYPKMEGNSAAGSILKAVNIVNFNRCSGSFPDQHYNKFCQVKGINKAHETSLVEFMNFAYRKENGYGEKEEYLILLNLYNESKVKEINKFRRIWKM